MKNPENKPLELRCDHDGWNDPETIKSVRAMMVANSNMARSSPPAMNHYIACVKYLEKAHGLYFVIKDE